MSHLIMQGLRLTFDVAQTARVLIALFSLPMICLRLWVEILSPQTKANDAIKN